MAQKKGEIVVGLDIGTTKICCIVGEVTPDGIDVIGIGTHPSRGLRKGVVINIEATVASIHKAVEEAELMAGAEISAVFAGIAGGHIRGFNSQGVVAVKDKEVKQGDLDRVLDAARAINIPQDREILHVLPQEYIIDEQDGIREPLGMSGVRLEAKVHIVTAAVSSAQNIVKCCAKAGLSVSDIVLEPLASAEAVLAEEETIEVPSVGAPPPRVVPRRILCEIVEPRVEERFQLVHREIQKAGQEDLLASGVVLTGGSTLLHGMPELAEEVLGLPARRGVPRGIGGLTDVVKSPAHATAVGLLLYGAKQGSQGMRAFSADAASIKQRFLGWV